MVKYLLSLIARLYPIVTLSGPGGHPFIVDLSRGRVVPVMAGGAPEGEEEAEETEEGTEEASEGTEETAAEGEAEGEGTEETEPVKREPNWKVEARKHERRAKAEKKRADDLAAKQKKLDDANKDQHAKDIDAAKEAAKAEALSEVEKERRADRLESATIRLASKGVTIGTGDKAKTVKFADADDALVHLERGIARGDIDGDDIFGEDGKVDAAALTTALEELLEAKPHLAAGPARTVTGGADAGKGESAGKGVEDMSVEDHIKRKMVAQR